MNVEINGVEDLITKTIDKHGHIIGLKRWTGQTAKVAIIETKETHLTDYNPLPVTLEVIPGIKESAKKFDDVRKEWSVANVVSLINEANRAVLGAKENISLKKEDISLRFLWAEDVDYIITGRKKTAYYTDTDKLNYADYETDMCEKVTFGFTGVRYYAICFIGMLMGDIGKHLKKLQVKVGYKKCREYPQAALPTMDGSIFLATDGLFTLEKKTMEIILHTDFKKSTKCTAFPYMVVILPAGA